MATSSDPRNDPQAIAIDALSFIAAEPDRLDRFLSLTGITPSLLRQAAQEPGFLAGVLDYMLADETLILAFVDHAGIRPEAIMEARVALSGGDLGDD